MSGHSGARNGSRRFSHPPPLERCPRLARSRSSVGVRWKISRTVSLNVRTLAKPAANATSPSGTAVVSISTRAVCARCALASASGPAPSSACTCRWICRTL